MVCIRTTITNAHLWDSIILLLYLDMGWQIHLDIIVIKKKMYLNIIYQNGKAATTYAILNLHAS